MQVPYYTDLQFKDAFRPCDEGTYEFEIIDTEAAESKDKGYPMSIVSFSYFAKDRMQSIKKYFVYLPEDHPQHMFAIHNIKEFFKAVGAEYSAKSHSFDNVLPGMKGQFYLFVNKDNYAEIKSFAAKPAPLKKNDDFPDDDIDF